MPLHSSHMCCVKILWPSRIGFHTACEIHARDVGLLGDAWGVGAVQNIRWMSGSENSSPYTILNRERCLQKFLCGKDASSTLIRTFKMVLLKQRR